MRTLLGPLVVSSLALACASSPSEPVRLRIAPTTLQGQSLLPRISSIRLAVYAEDTGVRCTDRGAVEGAADAGDPLARTELSRQGCPSGAAFCGSLELDQSDVARVFAAEGLDEAGGVFAVACSSVLLDQEQVSIDLQFQRALPTARCGDARVDAPETCEGDGDACNACVSQELLVSNGSAANGTIAGTGASKTSPSLVVGPRAIAVSYADSTTASEDGDIAMRVLSHDLDALASPPSLSASFFLANPSLPGPARAGAQGAPASCAADGVLFVAFETAGAGSDIAAQAFDATSFAARGEQVLLSGDGDSGTAGDQRAPSVACGPNGKAFVVWRDVASGRVLGRAISAPNTLGRVQELGGAGDGTRVSVARRSTGWVAAWESGRQIRLRVAGEDGTPSGGELILEGDAPRAHPSLAALADGRFALSYLEGESPRAVHVQRYDAEGRRLGEGLAVSEEGAECTEPTLASATNVGGAYAAVWLEGPRVRGRWLGGNAGFLLGPLTGTEDAFDVSVSSTAKQSPVAAATSGALIVGWHDVESGIVLRSMPLSPR